MPQRKPSADAPLAKRLQQLLLIYSAAGTLCIGLIVSLVALPPLYSRMAEAQENHLLFAVKTRAQAIDQWLSRTKDIAAQITSRTKAREKLEAYNRGETNLAELDAFSRPILGDALKKSKGIAGILRLDHLDRPAAAVGTPIPEPIQMIPPTPSLQPHLSGPFVIEGRRYLTANAPILNRDNQRVGTDIVLFHVAGLELLLTDTTELKQSGRIILGAESASQSLQFLFGADDSISAEDQATLREALSRALRKGQGVVSANQVVAYGPLRNAPWGVLVTVDKSELYSPVRGQLIGLAAALAALIAVGTLGMVLLLRPLAGRVIIRTDELERQIREKTADLEEARRKPTGPKANSSPT